MKKIIILVALLILSANIAHAASTTCITGNGINCESIQSPASTTSMGASNIHTTVSLIPNTSIISQGSPSVAKRVFINPVVAVWHWFSELF